MSTSIRQFRCCSSGSYKAAALITDLSRWSQGLTACPSNSRGGAMPIAAQPPAKQQHRAHSFLSLRCDPPSVTAKKRGDAPDGQVSCRTANKIEQVQLGVGAGTTEKRPRTRREQRDGRGARRDPQAAANTTRLLAESFLLPITYFQGIKKERQRSDMV